MKRAMEGITRVIRIREEKPSLQQMVRDGVVGEALWDKLLATEADIETEMQDIVEESNIYKPDWGKTFLQEASALVQNKLQQEAQKAAEELNATETVQSPVHKTKKSAPKAELVETDEERRERLQNELIEEEEKSKATKKKGKKAK
ncbi:Pre protein translocase subunit Sec66-domain-containing protein [Globomyces pollinis-pini]|nr:Pre protein translocase subunit Sec66-domain-containing protein [Globomyces pollinis-pini]